MNEWRQNWDIPVVNKARLVRSKYLNVWSKATADKKDQNLAGAEVIQHLQPLESQWKWETSPLTYQVFYHKIVLEWASTDVTDFLEDAAGIKLEGQ